MFVVESTKLVDVDRGGGFSIVIRMRGVCPGCGLAISVEGLDKTVAKRSRHDAGRDRTRGVEVPEADRDGE